MSVQKSTNEMSVAKVAKLLTGPYNGRDKLAKSIQFATMMVTYRMLQQDPDNETAKRMVAFMKHVGLSRKGMRLFKSVEVYQKLVVVMGKKLASDDLALNVMANGGMIVRWAYDNLGFLEKAKALDKADYGVTSNKWRAFASISYIILALKGIMKAEASYAAAREGDVEANASNAEKARAVRLAAWLELVGRFSGLMNALHSAKLYRTNEGVQGLFGFMDGFIALRKVWLAIK